MAGGRYYPKSVEVALVGWAVPAPVGTAREVAKVAERTAAQGAGFVAPRIFPAVARVIGVGVPKNSAASTTLKTSSPRYGDSPSSGARLTATYCRLPPIT